MAYAFVQARGTTGSGTSLGLTYTSNVTAGNLLVAGVSWHSTTETASLSDGINGAWTTVAASLASNGVPGYRSQIFYRKNAGSGSTTVTATITGSVTFIQLDLLEYSGGDTSAPLDTANGGTGTTTAVSVSLTTTANNDLVVVHILASGTASPGTPVYTERLNTAGNQTDDDTDAGTAGTISATGQDSGAGWNCATAAFFVSGAGGGGGGGTTVKQLAALGVG